MARANKVASINLVVLIKEDTIHLNRADNKGGGNSLEEIFYKAIIHLENIDSAFC
jgi:hypothetical protein